MNRVLQMRNMLIGLALVALMGAAVFSTGASSGNSVLTTFTATRRAIHTRTPAPESTAEIMAEVTAEAVAAGDPVVGEALFRVSIEGAPACSACHLTSRAAFAFHSVGPNLEGVATRAQTRVEGLTAAEYIRQSILDPSAYVVDTFSNAMYPNYAQYLSDEDVENLVAYLLTLEEPEA